jgi:uncharacterized protein with PIN domain
MGRLNTTINHKMKSHEDHIIFIIDGMLKGLARWLRILGFDAPVTESTKQAAQLLEEHPQAIFITGSKNHYKLFERYNSLLIKTHLISEQLAKLDKTYGIFHKIRPLSRCSICNVPLKEVEKNIIADQVPEKVVHSFSQFKKCPECGRIYWPGGHVIRMIDKLKRSGVPLSDTQTE